MSVVVETEGNIRLMTLSPDGQTLVMAVDNSGSNVVVSNNYDSLYSANASSGRRLASYRGHSGLVTCIQVTSDGLQLISGSEDTTVIVWQLHSGQLLLRIRYIHLLVAIQLSQFNDNNNDNNTTTRFNEKSGSTSRPWHACLASCPIDWL